MMKKLAENEYILSVMSKGANIINGMLASVIVNRYLGVSLKGEYAYLLNIVNTIVLIANLGFYQSYPYWSRRHGGTAKQKYLDIFFVQFLIYLIFTVIVSCFLGRYVYVITALMIPVEVWIKQLSMIFLCEDIVYRQKLTIILDFVRVALYACLFFLTDSSLVLVLLAMLVKDSIFIILGMRRMHYRPMITSIDHEVVIFALKFGAWALIGSVLVQLNYKVDIFFLKAFSDNYSIGIYSVGTAIAEYIWLIPDAFKEVLFSKTSKRDSIDEVVTSIKITVFISIFVILLLFPIMKSIIVFLYGIEYESAYTITRVLFLGVLPMILFKITNSLFLANGKVKFLCATLCCSVALNCGLNYLLIPKFNIMGAAISSVFSYFLCGIVFYIKFIREYRILWYEPLMMRKSDILFFKHKIFK